MTTVTDQNQLAVIISFVSLGMAALALGWNIYRDVLLKARVQTMFSISSVVSVGKRSGPYLSLRATNHGPGPVTILMIDGRNAPVWRRLIRQIVYFVILHDHTNPMSGQLPKRLEVGDSVTLLLPYDADCFLKNRFTRIGLSDSFGRTHWAPRRNIREVKASYKAKFGKGPVDPKPIQPQQTINPRPTNQQSVGRGGGGQSDAGSSSGEG